MDQMQTPPSPVTPPVQTPVASGPKKLPLNLTLGRFIAAVAAIAVVIGSFLPWATIMGMFSVSGTDGDGMITLIAGAVAIAAAIVKKVPIWVTLILGLVVVGVMGYDAYQMYDSTSGMGDLGSMSMGEENPFGSVDLVSIGIGAYLTALGGIGIVVGAIMEMKKKV